MVHKHSRRPRSLSTGYTQHQKPPRLRFRPGWFMRHRKIGQLYCIMYAYRLAERPNIWLFALEERRDFSPPGTSCSAACELLGAQVDLTPEQAVVYQPFRLSYDAINHFSSKYYKHGDTTIVSTDTLLNDFEHISSGEVID